MERHSLYGATCGATFATWSDIWSDIRYMSDIRYIGDIWSDTRYMANAHTCMHLFLHFHNAPIGNQVLSTSTRSSSSEIHATA